MTTITLTVGATTVALLPGLYWQDEFTWSPLEQSAERTVTGALVVDAVPRVGGRPITLGAPPDGTPSNFLQRAALQQLKAWADVPGQNMTLNMAGVGRTVRWAHEGGQPVIEAAPVLHWTDVDNNDYYRITLRFLEV